MCFIINRKARRPLQRKAYKIVSSLSLYPRVVISPFRSFQYRYGKRYSLRGLVVPSRRAFYEDTELRAYEGFYVYLSLAAAERACGFRSRIVECAVRPKDWLVSSSKQRMATYRSIIVKREVLTKAEQRARTNAKRRAKYRAKRSIT